MKTLLSAAAAVLALTTLAACGEEAGTTADDPARESSAGTTSSPADDPTTGTYPEFAPASYTYVLEQICFCPLTGPVRVTVEDGKVVDAVVIRGGHGIEKGSPAPDYLRTTINEVIARANDTEADEVDVTWPDGQDYPSRVAVDPVENAMDDEITYVLRNVQVAG